MNDLVREIIHAEIEERLDGRPPTRELLTEIFVGFAKVMLPPTFDVEVWPGREPNSISARLIPKKRQ